jgi:hypothetical protein
MADLTLASANVGATPKPPMSPEPARTILALDLGTTTGWALRSHDGLITSGTVSFRPGRFDGGGMRYLRFTNWLTELDRLSGPIAAIWFEEVRRHAGTDASPRLWRSDGHADRVGRAARRALSGRPRRHDQAPRHRQGQRQEAGHDRAARARGFSPADDNEADAIALLLWAIETNGGVA